MANEVLQHLPSTALVIKPLHYDYEWMKRFFIAAVNPTFLINFKVMTYNNDVPNLQLIQSFCTMMMMHDDAVVQRIKPTT